MTTFDIHPCSSQRTILSQCAALLLCGCALAASAQAESPKLGGVDLWVSTDESTPATGPTLLRPPASWSWDAAAPKLDFAAGIERNFLSGVSLGAGVSVAHVPDYSLTPSASTINYHDYFLGLSYGALDSKVWYLPESGLGEPSGLYYEAGWQQPVTDNFSLSVRLGQYNGDTSRLLESSSEMPSLSLGASTTLDGYGLGLRLIDSGGRMFGGEQDLQLMGSISKPLR